jgi:hypothetical protein
MEIDSRPGQPDEEPRCSWCNAGLRKDEVESKRQPVCERCVRMLLDAGLSDEEIFGNA